MAGRMRSGLKTIERSNGRKQSLADDENDTAMVIDSSSSLESLSLPPRRSLPEMVAERLVEAMRSGELKPGERLIETTLAKRFGISRAPLREAMKVLAASGLIVSSNGRGATVRAVADDDMVRMVVVRAMLEGLAARLVAAEAPQSALNELERLHEEIETIALTDSPLRLRQLDWSFHERVCLLSANPFLLESWRSISNIVRIHLGQRVGDLGLPEVLLDGHRRLLEALLSRDPDRAEAAFRSRLIETGYAALGLPVPVHLQAYLVQEPNKKPAAATKDDGQ